MLRLRLSKLAPFLGWNRQSEERNTSAGVDSCRHGVGRMSRAACCSRVLGRAVSDGLASAGGGVPRPQLSLPANFDILLLLVFLWDKYLRPRGCTLEHIDVDVQF